MKTRIQNLQPNVGGIHDASIVTLKDTIVSRFNLIPPPPPFAPLSHARSDRR
jgi:hypothetical protein